MTDAVPRILQALRHCLSDEQVKMPGEALACLTEWRGAFQPVAAAVVFPQSTAQVAAVVRCCTAHDCAVVAQSGNSGLVGGSAADDPARHVVLNLERMDRVREIDTDNATMTVEAGCILADAQRAAVSAGFVLPIQLASREHCRIGGNLATNAGGLNVVHYGNTRDRVLGLEVVLADGRIWHNLSGLRKDNSSYDFNNLFVGSEGTLGIITAAVLELADPPQQRAVAWCGLDDPGQAIALQRRLARASGGQIVGLELMSAQVVELACEHIQGCQSPLTDTAPWYLLVELATSAAGDWLAPILFDTLADALAEAEIAGYALARSAEDIAAFWHLRESLPPAQVAAGASIKHDISLPVSKLPLFIEQTLADIDSVVPGMRPCPFGHVGDGNLHFNLQKPIDMSDAQFKTYAPTLHRIVHDRVMAMGGSIAAEHGVGRLKVAEIAARKQPVEIDMLVAIKRALDPDNRLNPGVMVDAARLADG